MMEKTMKSMNEFELKTYENGQGLAVQMLPNGGLHALRCNDIYINQVLGNPLEGGLGKVFLRKHGADSIESIQMIGPQSPSRYCVMDSGPAWEGNWKGIHYCCRLLLDDNENIWFWRVDLDLEEGDAATVDAICVQDIGIASIGALRSNEAYTCQYIDHMPVSHAKYGSIVLSRQNQEQGDGVFPWVMQGCLQGTKSYLTDGFDFYGLSFKQTGVSERVNMPDLGNIKRQYEFGCICLQSEPVSLRGGSAADITFFGLFERTHPDASGGSDLQRLEKVERAARELKSCTCRDCGEDVPRNVFNGAEYLQAEALTEDEITDMLGGGLRHIERDENGTLYSFIYGREKYGVTPAKELHSERPHGHILRSGTSVFPDSQVMCSTNYMYGIFNAQVTIGNTSFSKLFSVPRNALNVTRVSGQRILVQQDGEWKLLGMPSFYETGISFTRWVYRTAESTITIRTWASAEDSAICTDIKIKGAPLSLMIAGEVVVGANEYEARPVMQVDEMNKMLRFRPDPHELIGQRQPETTFALVTAEAEKVEAIGGDELLFADGKTRELPYAVLVTAPTDSFSFVLTGSVESQADAGVLANKYCTPVDFETMVAQADAFWDGLMNRSALKLDNERIHRLHDLTKWYMHNAMVHYTVPHGLEQYGGAAWGTRDVCQGPVEFLLSYGRTAEVADILKLLFKHQYVEDGTWPQWFMFFDYANIQHFHCHGDIIIWPLKALCDYLEAANDGSILVTPIQYTRKDGYVFTEEAETLAQHVTKLIDYIESEFIDDTALICYGDGDWDDTLQPADSTMKTRMVSGWTVELVYQTFRRFEKISEKLGQDAFKTRVAGLADRIREDFNTYVIKDGVVSGFVYFDQEKGPRSLLHPSDEVTHIQYRLLPMTRGIISEIFTPEQAKAHREIIREHLAFPDGVHLMNRPVKYNGGTQQYFRRAETASNFGREIGMQYVHAHIRYIESLAKLGEADELFKALLTICPLKIRETVPNAIVRQSNAYFSSSDGAFLDRYEAYERFEELKDGRAQVKGGWRIYSSGPGIYINQLVSNFLGVRYWMDQVVLDPVLPAELNGLVYETDLLGARVALQFHIEEGSHSPRRVVVNGTDLGELAHSENPYRQGGALIPRARLEELMQQDGMNTIEVYC
jgi:cellobiose phosphorylase